MDFNQVWAKNAPVIGFLVAKTHFDHNGKSNPTCQFDCGAAWMAIALQARKEGLYSHGMAGIHYEAIVDYLKLDSDTDAVIMGFVIGKLGDEQTLTDKLREREVPSDRLPLDEIWLSKS